MNWKQQLRYWETEQFRLWTEKNLKEQVEKLTDKPNMVPEFSDNDREWLRRLQVIV